MKKFEFLEHTADVKMRIFGITLDKLFKNAVLGMAKLQKSKVKSQKSKLQFKIQKFVELKSSDLETLLVDFLSAVLTQSDIEHAVFPEIKIKKLTNTEIEAEIFGVKIDKFNKDIKAVTYHGAEVKKAGDHWEAIVLFDI
jgi:SHS2 domain-containing protein